MNTPTRPPSPLLSRRNLLFGLWSTGSLALSGYGLWQYLQTKPILYKSSLAWELAWSPNGQRLARRVAIDTPLEITDAFTGDKKITCGGSKSNGLAWSPDSKYIATTEEYTTITLWDTTNGQAHKTIPLTDKNFKASLVAWSPNGQSLLVAGQARSSTIAAYQYDAQTGQQLQALHIEGINKDPYTSISWSPNGKKIALHTAEERLEDDEQRRQSIYTYDATTGERLQVKSTTTTLTIPFRSEHMWSADSQYLAIKNLTKKSISILKITQQITSVNIHEQKYESTRGFTWSTQGHMIASCDDFHELHIWDALTGHTIKKIPTPNGDQPISMSWSPDGNHLAVSLSRKQNDRTWIVKM